MLSGGFHKQHCPLSRSVLFNHLPQSPELEKHPGVPIDSPVTEPSEWLRLVERFRF
jgi:hypothetical protein